MDTNQENREKMILRLKRVEGQLRGIQEMIVAEKDCGQIAQQMTAARKALDKAFYEMIACALMQECLETQDKATLESRIEPIKQLLTKMG